MSSKNSIRVPSKLASADEVQGAYGAQKSERIDIREASSTGATQQFLAEVEFGRYSILRSPIGKELDARFNEFFFRKNPEESPMARALVAHGYKVAIQPLQEQYTSNDWLASRVLMSGLSIIFRQPTPNDLLICMIERESGIRKMRSALLGIVEFIYFCHSHCPEVKYLGGCISKLDERNASLEFSMDRLVDFYNRTLGYIEAYENHSGFWIYADMHCKKRFQELPIWQRHQRKKLPFFKLIKF